MKRELKFRAYHKIQKRMFEVYGLGLDFVTENTLDGVSPGDNCWQGDELKNIEIMQFTGLTDKNGVEIYEGDIIKGVNGSINCMDWVFEPYVIKWNNEECKFNVPLWGTFDNQDSTHWFEVIGNIHEHKYLLK